MKTITFTFAAFAYLTLLLTASPRTLGVDFVKGKKITWKSKGHAKSKGLNVNVSYPSSWKAYEGSRPNVMQKFRGNNAQDGLVMLMTKALPAPYNRKLTEAEKKEITSKEVVMEFIPDDSQLISYKTTKIDGEIAAMIEYEIIGERAGYSIGQKILTFIIPHNGTILFIQSGTGGDASKGMAAIRNRYTATKTLFLMITSSCIFMDKWEK